MSKPVQQVKKGVASTVNTIRRSLSTTTNPPTYFGTGGAKYIGGSGAAQANKQWVHPPDVLQSGRVEYACKLLGMCEVKQNKGTDVIREAIKKIKFNLTTKRSELSFNQSKLRKVEIHINIDGLTVADKQTKLTLHKYPLHRISFCADDKHDKRVFAFIAKRSSDADAHDCFVFLSEKNAEQITLTIGEAFDLAYQRFLTNNGRDLETKKQMILLKNRIKELETENSDLKKRLIAYQKSAPKHLQAFLDHPLTVFFPFSTNGGGSVVVEPPRRSWESFEPGVLPRYPPPDHPPPLRPPTATRHNLPESMSAVLPGLDSGPQSARGLDNVNVAANRDSLPDEDFDPRAQEPQERTNGITGGTTHHDQFGLAPFDASSSSNNVLFTDSLAGANAASSSSQTDVDAVLRSFDSRLLELSEIGDGLRRGLQQQRDGGGVGGDGPLLSAADALLLSEFDPLTVAGTSETNGVASGGK